MQSRFLFDFLPCYGLNSLPNKAPVCFATFRAAQFLSKDVRASIGLSQQSDLKKLTSPGEGASLLLASSPADMVLVRAGRNRNENKRLREGLSLISEHLKRCGIETGAPRLHTHPEREIIHIARTHLICPSMFNLSIEQACQSDNEASNHSAFVRRLWSKISAHRPLASARVPVQPIFELNTAADVSALVKKFPPPWVMKAEYGAGGEQVAFAETASEAHGIWKRARKEWGSVFGEQYKPGTVRHYVYFSIDPKAAGPRFLMAGRIIERDGHLFNGNHWDAALEKKINIQRPRQVARVHHSLARKMGASLTHMGQDWQGTEAGCTSYLETNPRMCAGTVIAVLRARYPGPLASVRNLILPRNGTSTAQLLAKVRPIEATPSRGRGVIIYSSNDLPTPHALAMTINDGDGRCEAALRRLL